MDCGPTSNPARSDGSDTARKVLFTLVSGSTKNEINLAVVDFTARSCRRAALNFGDAMTYAAAKLANEPLIAVGNDFGQTDLEFDGVIDYWPHSTSRHP